MIRLVIGGDQVDISRDSAPMIVDHLWKGLEQGAVTAAARMTEFLGHDDADAALIFPEYETFAVRDALQALDPPAA